MSKGLIERSILTDIADAIREKTGTEDPIKPVDMAEAVRSISGGGGEFIRFDCTGVVGTFTVPKTGTTWRTSTTISPVIQKGCRFHASLKNNTATACTYYVDVTANGESWTRLFTKDSSTATDIIAVPLDDYVGHAITVRLGVYNKHQYNDWTWTIDTMYIDNPDELVLFENGVYLNPDIFEGFTNLGINATTKAITMSFNGTGGNSYLSKKSIDTTRYNTVHMLVDTTYSTGYSIPTWNFVLKYSDSSDAISDYDSFNGAVVGRESVIKVKEGSRVNIEVGYSSKQQIITCSIYKIWLAYDPQIEFSDTSIIPYYFKRMKNYRNGSNSSTQVRSYELYKNAYSATFGTIKPIDLTDVDMIECDCEIIGGNGNSWTVLGIYPDTTKLTSVEYPITYATARNYAIAQSPTFTLQLNVESYSGLYYIALFNSRETYIRRIELKRRSTPSTNVLIPNEIIQFMGNTIASASHYWLAMNDSLYKTSFNSNTIFGSFTSAKAFDLTNVNSITLKCNILKQNTSGDYSKIYMGISSTYQSSNKPTNIVETSTASAATGEQTITLDTSSYSGKFYINIAVGNLECYITDLILN